MRLIQKLDTRRLRWLGVVAALIVLLYTPPVQGRAAVDCWQPDTCQQDNPSVCYQEAAQSCPAPCWFDFFAGICVYWDEGEPFCEPDSTQCYCAVRCYYNCYC